MSDAPSGGPRRLAVVTSHPIQYQAPWFRGLARHCDLQVFFAHRQSAREQADAGFGVAFDWDVDLTTGYAHEYLDNVSRAPNVYAFGGCDTPQIHARLAADRFDAVVVTGWYLKCYAQTVLAAHRLGIPVLVRGDSRLGTPRAVWRRALKQPAYRVGLRAFSAFLSVGRRHTEYLRHYGVPESRIFFAPHFVDAEHFAAPFAHGSKEHAAARREIGIAPGASLVLFVGRLLEFKRPIDVVRALGLLRRRGIAAELAIVGHGPLASAIEREAAKEGVVLHLLGFRNQRALPALYACADVLALPSDANETWGLVVNEAMSCGVPAVVSDQVGCAPDLIAEGQTGYVHPLGDVPRLADALAFAFGLRRRPETPAILASKMRTYGCEAAVAGTLTALQAVQRRLQ
jgi:glycosyltransferase involved in cell wall biosynthesis